MNFVVSVIHSVDDLADAAAFLCRVLGFQQKPAASNAIIVENGAVAIRLVTAKTELPNTVLTLELHTQDTATTLTQLRDHAGISLLHQAENNVRQERTETLLQAPHGIKIMLVQEFNEDQLDISPPLPTELIWHDEAEACVKRMLKLVPISFRQPARVRVTERAEMIAGENASITVTLADALHALADTTPLFQRAILISTLQAEGIDTTIYFQENSH